MTTGQFVDAHGFLLASSGWTVMTKSRSSQNGVVPSWRRLVLFYFLIEENKKSEEESDGQMVVVVVLATLSLVARPAA